MNYLWPTPTLLGYTEAPSVSETNYAEILRSIPDGQAAILEYENEVHLRSGQNVMNIVAQRDCGFRIRTKAIGFWDGKPRLLVWKVQS